MSQTGCIFIFHQSFPYGAAGRMDRLCRYMEERGEAVRLVAEAEFPAVDSKLAAIRKLVRKNRDLLRKADCIVVFGELEIVALFLVDRSLLQKTCYLQREDNGEKYLYLKPRRTLHAQLKCSTWIAIQKLLLPRLRLILVQTPHHEEKLRRRCGERIPPLEVVSNDIPPRFRQPAPVTPLAAPLRIGVICGSNPVRKGLDLVRLGSDPINFNTLIAANQLQTMARYAPTLIDERCDVTKDGDAVAFLLALDVLLVPSRYDECPNVVLEALGTGTPILCSDIPAHRYLLGDNYSGFVDFSTLSVTASGPNFEPQFLQSLRQQILSIRERFMFDWEQRVISALQGATAASRA